MVQYGSEIMVARRQIVGNLSAASSRIHKQMTGGSEDLRLSYRTTVPFFVKEKEMDRAYHKRLVEKREYEILQGITLIGPHRDDNSIYSNSIDLCRYGSQGQSRTCTLSLKLAELELMKSFLREYPITLFDDVMSELDSERRRSFLNLLDRNVQSFITTTELGVLDSIKERASIFDIERRERAQWHT